MTTFRTGMGRSITVGRELASGGEGRVHEVADAASDLVKIYHRPPPAAVVDKLRALVKMRTPELSEVAAWPTDVLLSPSGGCVGFVMPRISSRGVIDRLSHPAERRQHFAESDYLFITTVAANLMAAASRLHAHGIVIGDVNESNVMVRPNGTVSFIDVDSFQVTAGGAIHRCMVAKDLFIPPELVGRNLSAVDRTPMHDCFSLAILVFQLLMNGRHPFHGCVLDGVDRSTEELVVAGAYAYSAASRLPMRPPPGAMPVASLGLLAPLFERAFLATTRPSATEWSVALSQFRTGLRPCKANGRHALFPGQQACTLCALPRDPLPAPIGGSPGNAPDVGLIRQLFAEIGRLHAPAAAVAAVNQPPVSAAERELPVNPGEPAAAEVAKSLQVAFPLGLWLSAVAAGVITVGISNTPRGQGMACMVGGVSGILFITAVAQLSRWASTRGAKRYAGAFAARRSAMDQEIATLEAVERAAADVWSRQAALGPRIERLRAAAAELAASDQRDLANIHANAAQRFRDRWRHDQLDNFLIATATISGIGLERKRVLASHGIETAADVNRADVRSVPRFGPKLTDALIDWRDECLRAVSKRPVPAMPPGFVEALHREHVARLAKAAEGVATEYRAIKGLIHESEFAARHHAIAVAGARVAFRKARQDALRICA